MKFEQKNTFCENNKNYIFHGKQAIVFSNGDVPDNSEALARTSLFKEIISKFIKKLENQESPLLDLFSKDKDTEDKKNNMIKLLQQLSYIKIDEIDDLFFAIIKKDKKLLNEFVEEMYNFWRSYERFFVCYSNNIPHHKQPYRTFNNSIELLNGLSRKLYRDICENITDTHPTVFRQIPAFCQVGTIVAKNEYTLPAPYNQLNEINHIRQVLIEPPFIIDPTMNKRTGQFTKVGTNPFEKINISSNNWLCYPARVGNLLIHVYFNNKFIGLGASLANLFELADESFSNKKPDAVYAFGVDEDQLSEYGELPTVFYDDKENNMFCAAVPYGEEYGYFGYLKKMVLTLHNSIVMKQNLLPIHGAMVNIKLKNNKSAKIVILGDSGAGKSESIEAFQTISKDYIKEMKIVFDDMGCFDIDKNGSIVAYGTETGAFVRLDDLAPDFAFVNIDRSIIMSPQKVNARAVLPITTIDEVLKGHKVDYLLYANNFDEISQETPIISFFKNAEDALEVFKAGKSMSKGTTTSTGLTGNYFANIFGPVQYKELHDEIATKFFNLMFKTKVGVGQLRTQLGIKGMEKEGPIKSAKEIMKLINGEINVK